MKFLDEKGRLFGKINLFDLIAIVILILGVVLIVGRTAEKEPEPAPAPEIVKEPEYHYATIEMKITGLRDYKVESLAEGDEIYEGAVKIGVIKEIDVYRQKVDSLQEDGSYKAVSRVLFNDVELTIETDRFYEEEGRFVNGKVMLNGTGHSLTNGILPFDAVVQDVTIGDVVEEDEESEEETEENTEEEGEKEE